MKLPGELFGELQEAITAAFKINDLEEVCRIYLDASLDTIVAVQENFATVVFNLLEWVEHHR